MRFLTPSLPFGVWERKQRLVSEGTAPQLRDLLLLISSTKGSRDWEFEARSVFPRKHSG